MPTLKDAAFGMEEENRKTLEDIINRHWHLRKYYILIHSRPHDTDQILTKFVLSCRKPLKELFGLATCCYEVDNLVGTMRRLWALAPDFAVDERLLDPDKSIPEQMLKDAQGVLIIN